jgi:hypothetical protein
MTFPRVRVHALVLDPRRLDRHRPCRGGNRAFGVIPVAHHQTTAVLVALLGELREIGVDLGLQRGGEHPPSALAHDLVDQRAVRCRPIGVHYGKHGRVLSAEVGASAYS